MLRKRLRARWITATHSSTASLTGTYRNCSESRNISNRANAFSFALAANWAPHPVQDGGTYVGYKSVRFVQPAYLSELLHRHAPVRQTRSSDKDQLIVPTMRTNIGSRAFSHAAPSVWNSLQEDLKEKITINSFKCGLNTHLFTSAYDCLKVGASAFEDVLSSY